jgi:hypothetical protein
MAGALCPEGPGPRRDRLERFSLALIGRVYALAVLDVLEHACARRPLSRTR